MLLGKIVEEHSLRLPQRHHMAFKLPIFLKKIFVSKIKFSHNGSLKIWNHMLHLSSYVIEVSCSPCLFILDLFLEIREVVFLFTQKKKHLLTVKFLLREHWTQTTYTHILLSHSGSTHWCLVVLGKIAFAEKSKLLFRFGRLGDKIVRIHLVLRRLGYFFRIVSLNLPNYRLLVRVKRIASRWLHYYRIITTDWKRS